MPIDLGGGKSIVSMTLFDLHTGKETTLFEREGSRCQFHEDIYFKGYIITLRVHWGDIRNTDPVLDADIYVDVSDKKGKKIRSGKWHHTLKEFSLRDNLPLYEFEFNQLRLRLGAVMTFALSVGMDAIIVSADED